MDHLNGDNLYGWDLFTPSSYLISGNLQDSWLTDYDPQEHMCFFASSATGWTNDDLGYSWLTTIFDRYTKPKARNGRDYRLLFVDGHGSHINMKFLNWCEQHNVLVALYPPHSTHRLQPLDVSLFNPLANYYSQNLNAWIFNSQGFPEFRKETSSACFGLHIKQLSPLPTSKVDGKKQDYSLLIRLGL